MTKPVPSERDREMALPIWEDIIGSARILGKNLQIYRIEQGLAAARAEGEAKGRLEAIEDRIKRDNVLFKEGIAFGQREAALACAKISDDQARLADEDGNPDAVAACRIAARRQRALAEPAAGVEK